MSILTYACEVWEYENLDMFEKVQNHFLRRITCSKYTALYMLYGELGRYPLEITIKSRMIGFWYRITHGNPLKLSSVLYQCFLHSSHTNFKWLTCIKSIFTKIGPGRVAQSVGHLTRKSGVLGSIPGLATYFRFSFRFFKKGSCQLLAKVCARSTG